MATRTATKAPEAVVSPAITITLEMTKAPKGSGGFRFDSKDAQAKDGQPFIRTLYIHAEGMQALGEPANIQVIVTKIA